MTKARTFTLKEQLAINRVAARVKAAREAMHLSTNEAASLSVGPRGAVSTATWQRFERGYFSTRNGQPFYPPTPPYLVAMAEVVGLDGYQLCRELGWPEPARLTIDERTIMGMEVRLEKLRRQVRSTETQLSRAKLAMAQKTDTQ